MSRGSKPKHGKKTCRIILLTEFPSNNESDLNAFLHVLPDRIQRFLKERDDIHVLIEIVMDLGRPAEARFPEYSAIISGERIAKNDIKHVLERIGGFDDDNRSGVERTLHRISVIRNRAGNPIGLTCRVGRAVSGNIRLIEDLVKTSKNVLLLGRPGVGKTTMLRTVARFLADEANKRVIIVDTSNEIGGDGDEPHPAVGRARRMQVPNTSIQHKMMIEAVENHMPEAIIIDEMSTELEALAARTIAERGVQLIATAHGNTLENVIFNPALCDLVGGVETVTLGDIEARRRRTQKTALERRQRPTFDAVIEIRERNLAAAHKDVAAAVDRILLGTQPSVILQQVMHDGSLETTLIGDELPQEKVEVTESSEESYKIYLFGISKTAVEDVVKKMNISVSITDDPRQADLFATTKSHYNRRPAAIRTAEHQSQPVYVLRRSTDANIRRFIAMIKAQKSPDIYPQEVRETFKSVKMEGRLERITPSGDSPINHRATFVRTFQNILRRDRSSEKRHPKTRRKALT